MEKTEEIRDVKKDAKMMLNAWVICQEMNDPSGVKLFAGILLKEHGLDVSNDEQMFAF